MACPLCGDQCHCPAPTAGEHVSVLIDPEDYVDTEQKFASSVHDDETLTHDVSDELLSDDEPLGDLEEVVTHAASIGSGTPVITPQLEAPTVVQAVATEPPGFYRPLGLVEIAAAVCLAVPSLRFWGVLLAAPIFFGASLPPRRSRTFATSPECFSMDLATASATK